MAAGMPAQDLGLHRSDELGLDHVAARACLVGCLGVFLVEVEAPYSLCVGQRRQAGRAM
jgi:hypothetical protein